MSYESSLKRLPNFLRYANKVYRFSQTIDSMQSKVAPETSPQTIFMSVFLCLLLRFGSFRQLPKDVVQGEEAGHEGEGIAAKRLIEKMIALYGNGFFDILTTDALYTNEPFVTFVDSLNKYLVSRVKDERTTIYKEIQTLSALVKPIYTDDWEEQMECWIYEIPELQASLAWDVPTRGFKIRERKYKIVSGEKVYIKDETFLCITTLPDSVYYFL